MFNFIKKIFKKDDELNRLLKDIVIELRNINKTLSTMSLNSVERNVNRSDKVKRQHVEEKAIKKKYTFDDGPGFVPSITESNLSGNDMVATKSNIKESSVFDSLNALEDLNKKGE